MPIRVEAWVSWWTTPAARSIVWDRSSSSGVRQAVKVPVPPSSQGPGVRQAVKVPVPPSSEGPGVSAPRLYFLAESIRCPSELRCLTRLKNVPIRVEAWVSWWTTPAARSIVWDRSSSSGSPPSSQGPGSAKQ